MKIIQDIKNLFSPKAWKQATLQLQEEFQKKGMSLGQFIYTKDGFIYSAGSDSTKVNWKDVLEIIAYKEDLIIEDEIRIKIVSSDSTLSVSEETPGYYIFKEKIKTTYPDSEQDWESKVVKPAFAENWTIIYKRKNNGM